LKQTGTTVEVDEASSGIEGGSGSAEGGTKGVGRKKFGRLMAGEIFQSILGFCVGGYSFYTRGIIHIG
jgi:hypothetical protein